MKIQIIFWEKRRHILRFSVPTLQVNYPVPILSLQHDTYIRRIETHKPHLQSSELSNDANINMVNRRNDTQKKMKLTHLDPKIEGF